MDNLALNEFATNAFEKHVVKTGSSHKTLFGVCCKKSGQHGEELLNCVLHFE